MTASGDPTVASVVARFFDHRRAGRRASLDDVLDSFTGLTNRAATRAEALRVIVEWSRSNGPEEVLPGRGQGAADAGPGEFPTPQGYDIIDVVDQGGMGIVYEAYQRSTGRRVALKFMLETITATEAARRRFEREIELVARLHHPHIVSVMDSGTHKGRQFYVMDYVKGTPLDRAQVPGAGDVRRTLRLVEQVCRAVDYAHQRGVLHRDLKPSNILIDERGEPHLLDFGLAKGIDPEAPGRLEMSLSQPGQLLGTLGYMSPEQAAGQFDKISVRSDVYSIGVMAYLLLTGVLPCPIAGPLADVLDGIAHRSPARPSSVRRGIRADVDAILLMALEKSPDRRYPTAGEFAADIERFLADKTIVARRAGLAARAFRLARRHRSIAAVGAAALLLIAAVTSGAFLRIRSERDRALLAEQQASAQYERARQVSDFLVDMFQILDPGESVGSSITAREILDKAAERASRELDGQPVIQAAVMEAIGSVYRNLGLYDSAAPALGSALETRRHRLGSQHPDVGRSLSLLADLRQAQGAYVEAEELWRQAIALLRRCPDERWALALSLNGLGGLLVETGHNEEAEQFVREALAMQRQLLGNDHPDVARSINNLAWVLHNRGAYAEAERLYREALAARRRIHGPQHQEVALSLDNLAGALAMQGRFAEAEEHYRQALAMRRKLLGDSHPEVATSLHYLGWLLYETGDLPQAELLYRDALQVRRHALSPDHPDLARTLVALAMLLTDKGDPAGAEPLLREAVDIVDRALPAEHWLAANARSTLGECLVKLGRFAQAEPLLLQSYPIIEAGRGQDHPRTVRALHRIIDLYDGWDKPEQADEYRVRLSAPTAPGASRVP